MNKHSLAQQGGRGQAIYLMTSNPSISLPWKLLLPVAVAILVGGGGGWWYSAAADDDIVMYPCCGERRARCQCFPDCWRLVKTLTFVYGCLTLIHMLLNSYPNVCKLIHLCLRTRSLLFLKSRSFCLNWVSYPLFLQTYLFKIFYFPKFVTKIWVQRVPCAVPP